MAKTPFNMLTSSGFIPSSVKEDLKALSSASKSLHDKVIQKAVSCSQNPKKEVPNILTDIILSDGDEFVKQSENLTKPVVSIINNTLDAMSESSNPLIKKNADFVKSHPEINVANIITDIQDSISTKSADIKNTVDNITDEVAVNVVKKKAKNKLFNNKFVIFLSNLINKLKNSLLNIKKTLQ